MAWFSKKQSCVAQSSCEAEYVAAANLSNELTWWRQLSADMGQTSDEPLTIWCDNQSAGILSQHAGKFGTTKHIALKYHVLRQRQANGEVVVRWCSAANQLADIFTKNTQVGQFKRVATLILETKI